MDIARRGLAEIIQRDFPEIANDYADFPCSKLVFMYGLEIKYADFNPTKAELKGAVYAAIAGENGFKGLIRSKKLLREIGLKHRKNNAPGNGYEKSQLKWNIPKERFNQVVMDDATFAYVFHMLGKNSISIASILNMFYDTEQRTPGQVKHALMRNRKSNRLPRYDFRFKNGKSCENLLNQFFEHSANAIESIDKRIAPATYFVQSLRATYNALSTRGFEKAQGFLLSASKNFILLHKKQIENNADGWGVEGYRIMPYPACGSTPVDVSKIYEENG